MSPEKTSKNSEKSNSIDFCVKKASNYMEENGLCLFLFDVKDSKKFPSRQILQERLIKMSEEINQKFDKFLPENNLAAFTRTEKGFVYLLGDASWAGINNAEVIPKIINFMKENYSDISFKYGVACDGSDTKNLKIAR